MKDAFGVATTLLLTTGFLPALIDQTLMEHLQRRGGALLVAAPVFTTGSISVFRLHGTNDATTQGVAALVDEARVQRFKGHSTAFLKSAPVVAAFVIKSDRGIAAGLFAFGKGGRFNTEEGSRIDHPGSVSTCLLAFV